jgi:hypothetical protein
VPVAEAQWFTFIGLNDRGFTAVGGFVPDGAAAVVVFDAAGARHDAEVAHGAWAAVLPGVDEGNFAPTIEFRDHEAGLVKRLERPPTFAERVSRMLGESAADGSMMQIADQRSGAGTDHSGAEAQSPAPGRVLDEDQVRAVVSEEGLAAATDEIVRAVRSGYRLDLDLAAVPSPGTSKIGGDPDLAPDEAWPTSRTGTRMVFLAQIDLAKALPLPTAWPTTGGVASAGLMRVFANLREEPGEPCAARILITSCPVDELKRTAPAELSPADPCQHEDNDGGEEFCLSECMVRPMPFLTLPASLAPIEELSLDRERYQAVVNRLRADGIAPAPSWNEVFNGQWLGHPGEIQSDPRETAAYVADDPTSAEQAELGTEPSLTEPDAWQVLLSLHDDPRMNLRLGDGGGFYVLVPAADLRGRLDRVICDQQSA